jgi:hypothetical protein
MPKAMSVSLVSTAQLAGAYTAQDDIQRAIKLHEDGGKSPLFQLLSTGKLMFLTIPDLEHSTAMFGRLADPGGANNALSQVLYGLALR